MGSLLYMLPLGSPWFQWDENLNAQRTLGILAQDSSNIVIVGDKGCGKTALSFQAAVSMATDNRRVMFIRPQVLSRLPLPVHGMPTPEARALQLMKLWYPDHADELVIWCANVHLHPVLPEAIIVDDFDFYIGHSKDHEHEAARLCAVLIDAAAFIASKSGKCHVILTASNRLSSLPSVLNQFNFLFARVHNLFEEGPQKKYQMISTVHDKTTVTVTYNMTEHKIQLDTAEHVRPKS